MKIWKLSLVVILLLTFVIICQTAEERKSPDALITQTNLTGAVTDIDEDPNTPDANWLVPVATNTDTICRVSFPTPTGNPTEGAGVQQFQIWVKRVSTRTAKTPTVRIELRETGGGVLATPLADTIVTNDTGILLSGTWDASLLATADGSAVECYIYGTASVAGGNSSTIGVGAVEWNVTYSAGETQELISTTAIATSTTGVLDRGVTETLVSASNIVTSTTGVLDRGVTETLTSTSAIVSSGTGALSRGVTQALISAVNIVGSVTGTLSRGVTETLISTSNMVVSISAALSKDEPIFNYFGCYSLP